MQYPSASKSFDTSCFPTWREGRHFSLSLPHISPPTHPEFHPHLYPRSICHAAWMMAVNRSSYLLGSATVFTEPDWQKIIEAKKERDARSLEKGLQQQQSAIDYFIFHSQHTWWFGIWLKQCLCLLFFCFFFFFFCSFGVWCYLARNSTNHSFVHWFANILCSIVYDHF